MKKLLTLFVCLLAMVGCTKTEYITVERVRIDTTYIAKYQRDSIYLHDSTIVKEAGDTLFVEKWHTKYVLKELYDTLYQAKIDSVPVPYPIEVEVPAELTWWQQAKMHLGTFFLWLVLLFGLMFFIKHRFFN